MMKDGKLFHEIDENCWSPEARIKDMDATGLCILWLNVIPTGLTFTSLCFMLKYVNTIHRNQG